MILILLLAVVWVGYALQFAWSRRNDHVNEKDPAWWTPIFMFFVGLVVFVLEVMEQAVKVFGKAMALKKKEKRDGE